jgi:UDP-N-acetylmuramoylalanine--D-glutamate ligase
LVSRIAEAARESAGAGLKPGRVWVGGNIGNPLLSNLDIIQPDDLAVMEISSFQLEVMCSSPQVAVVLNITPNHLDRHGTMEAYTAAKRRILEFQGSDDTAVLSCEDPGAWSLVPDVKAGALWTFGTRLAGEGHYPGAYVKQGAIWLWDGHQEREIMPLEVIALRYEHNCQNVLAACAVVVP